MHDEWFPYIAFPISLAQFRQLPKNPIYKWEYWDGHARLTARPKPYHCLLDLAPRTPPKTIDVHRDEVLSMRRLADRDWEQLPPVFAAAFSGVPPFCGMEKESQLAAARHCLEKTRDGGEGPLVEQACFVAVDEQDEPCGAALITLGPDTDLTSLDDLHWRTTPPNPVERRLGRPHLTWVFVWPMLTRHGIGSALLAHSINALVELGYSQLASTFCLGNESSTLWHWMNRFRLVSWVCSPRAMKSHVRKTT